MIKKTPTSSTYSPKTNSKKARGRRLNYSEILTSYVMIIPLFFLLVGLILYPVFWNISLSLQSEEGIASILNYRVILEDPIFAKVVKNTTIWTSLSVLLQFIVGLGVAILLNQKVKGLTVFRAIILVLPWATPDIVAAVAWKWIYNDMYGVLNDVLMRLNFIDHSVTWLGNKDLALYMVIIANTWKGFSLSAMFYLAALQGVPSEMIDAARVDGANNIAVFRNVLIPYLLPTIGTTVMLTIIFTINYFPLIYMMTGGGPAQATETFVTWSYTLGFKFLHFPKSAVVSTINFLIILIFAIIYASRFVKNMEEETN